MPAVALWLYLVFLFTAFVLRSYLHYRRTGSTGFRGVSGRPGSAEWWGGVLFVLAVVLGLAGPALQLAGVISAIVDLTVAHVAGLVLAVVGIVGTLVAQQGMGESWRIGVAEHEATALVTGGPFGLVRNPIFTTMITAALGLTLLAPNAVTLPATVALVAAIEVQVRLVEEPYLLATHRAAYRAYAARVGRFLPGLGRLPDTARS